MSYIEKEKLIKADIASIENRVRHAFNQGYDLGFKDGKNKQSNCSEISKNSPTETLISLDVYKQVAKERDIAIEQLHELGYEFGQKIEPTTNNDLALIRTEGLEEEIRCTMCTNSMQSDRGCDGSCVVNNAMYKEVMDVIENHIVSGPTTTVSLEVYKQVAWERDIAIEQLHELGYEFGEKIKSKNI